MDQERAAIAAQHLIDHMGLVKIGATIFNATEQYVKARAMSPATVRRELGVLKAAMQWALNNGLIPYVPPVYHVKASPPKLRVLTDDEMRRLVKFSKTVAPEWMHNFVMILLLTGQRKEAVLGLRWHQVDLKNRVIRFTDETLSLNERRKGRGTVPINDELLALLNDIDSDNVCKFVPSSRCVYVIHDGRQNRITAIYNAWNTMTKAAGLDGVTPHVLRHTVATNLVRNKADIYQVSKLLGHASVQTTERVYVHADHEPLRKMMDTISAQPQRQESI